MPTSVLRSLTACTGIGGALSALSIAFSPEGWRLTSTFSHADQSSRTRQPLELAIATPARITPFTKPYRRYHRGPANGLYLHYQSPCAKGVVQCLTTSALTRSGSSASFSFLATINRFHLTSAYVSS